MPFGCKRPLVSNVYYPTFNLPARRARHRPDRRAITRAGIVTADGASATVDTIILATGFTDDEVPRPRSTSPAATASTLDDAWADGAQAYLGITTTGFPNLFMLYGPNTNNGSIIYMIECQAEYVVRARMDDVLRRYWFVRVLLGAPMRSSRRRACSTFCPTPISSC